MQISDLTEPQAVLDAISEYDEIGPEAFHSKYGFGPAISYFVQVDGKLYDSKAITAAAIGFQYGRPLQNDFKGGEPVARVLRRLGFRITGPGHWHYRIGEVTRRSEISQIYGGGTQGGIEPSARTPNVFLFTDPSAGAQHGYNFDGWDGDNSAVFHYTGEGQSGDQNIESRGNFAIFNQTDAGRALRLFASEQGRRSGGKLQTYVGAFRIDSDRPFRLEDAPDNSGAMRKVIVFRLISDDAAPNAGDPRAESPEKSAQQTVMEIIDPERNDVYEYETSPATGKLARRQEARLVRSFEDHLRQEGHEVSRRKFTLPRGQGVLITDTFDETVSVLYEAKSDIKRSTIRLALGQILDYRRLFDSAVGARVLLPSMPSDDLIELLHDYDIGVTFGDGEAWETLDPA
ncbi:hypothetical protein GCM10008944_03790 [Cytobacillus oceanisediminis]